MTIQRALGYARRGVDYLFLTFFLLDVLLIGLTIYFQLTVEPRYVSQYLLGYGYAFTFVLIPGSALFIAYSVGMFGYRDSWAEVKEEDKAFVYAVKTFGVMLVCNVLYFISLRLPIW